MPGRAPGDIEPRPGRATRGDHLETSTRDRTSTRAQHLETSAISQDTSKIRPRYVQDQGHTWKHQTTTRDGTSQGATWSASAISQGKRPGAHSSRTTRRTDARGTPGDIEPRPGTSEPGRNLETSATTRDGTSQGHTWSASSKRPGTERARAQHLEASAISQGKRPGGAAQHTTRRTDARGTPGDHDQGRASTRATTWRHQP
jgi:hypothetical protein